MRKLITANEVRQAVSEGTKVIYLEPGTIITPAARDAAKEQDIKLEFKSNQAGGCPEQAPLNFSQEKNPSKVHIDQGLISRVIQEVLAALPGLKNRPMAKEVDPSGFCLVRGKTVECDAYATDNPKDKVGVKEIFSPQESPHLKAGFMTLEETHWTWNWGNDGLAYIVEGILDVNINGQFYRGRAGDILLLPKDTRLTFSTPDKVKFFFVTYPA